MVAVVMVVVVVSGAPVSASAPSEPALPETPRSLPVEDAVARTLASPRYRFCAEPRYPLLAEETLWCAGLPRSPDPRATRCPGFLAACRAGATATLLPPRKPINIALPDFGGVGRVVLWALAAAAVGLLVFFLVRHGFRLPGGGRARREAEAEKTDRGSPVAGAGGDEAVERDVDRLLARAQASAVAGDFAAAVADLHAALLRRLEGDGHIRIHLSATNGDYVRELRSRAPALAAPVGDVVRDVETAEFGAVAPDRGMYRALLDRITPLLAGSAGGRHAPGAAAMPLALLCLGGLLSSSCQPSLRPDWAASPSGSAAVADFLTAAGLTTRERLASIRDLGKDKEKNKDKDQDQDKDQDSDGEKPGGAVQLVLLPGAEMGDPEWAALRSWLDHEDRTLVLATGPRKVPAWLADVEIVATGGAGPIRPAPPLVASGAPVQSTGEVPGSAWVRTGVSGSSTLIMRGNRAYATIAQGAAGRVIVVADDRLFVNAALVVEDNAALLAALLRAGGGPIELVGEDTGVVAPNPAASVARGRLAPFMAQLGICLILFLVMQGRAFGRLVDPTVTRRRVFSEHVRALGVQYARARAAGHALAVYATWALDRLRDRIRVSGDRGIGDLSAAVAARTGRPLGEVARVLFSARIDDEDRSRAATEQHLAMMRELGQIVAETSASTTSRTRTATRTRRLGRGRIRET